jgi:hypothetical protein
MPTPSKDKSRSSRAKSPSRDAAQDGSRGGKAVAPPEPPPGWRVPSSGGGGGGASDVSAGAPPPPPPPSSADAGTAASVVADASLSTLPPAPPSAGPGLGAHTADLPVTAGDAERMIQAVYSDRYFDVLRARGSELATATKATVKMRRVPDQGICVIRVSGDKACAGHVIERLETLIRCQNTHGVRDSLPRNPDADVDGIVGPWTHDVAKDSNNQRAVAHLHEYIMVNTGQMTVGTNPQGIAPADWSTFWSRPDMHEFGLAVQREKRLADFQRVPAIKKSAEGCVFPSFLFFVFFFSRLHAPEFSAAGSNATALQREP